MNERNGFSTSAMEHKHSGGYMKKRIQSEERTSFQEAGDYDPVIDSRADVAMVYGINESFEKRVAHWREVGYRIHVMTGIAWGGYRPSVI